MATTITTAQNYLTTIDSIIGFKVSNLSVTMQDQVHQVTNQLTSLGKINENIFISFYFLVNKASVNKIH